jgi:type I restriction enzyme, S subunit
MSSRRWPIVNLGEVASLTWRGEPPEPGQSYRLIGVRLWGKGAYVRETIDGSETQYSELFRVEEGDIIVNKIWARNGSVGVIGSGEAGAFGSSEFPTYTLNRERLDPKWASWFMRLPSLWAQCEELSRGTSGQNRLRPERFLNVELPLPPIAEQHRLARQLDSVAAYIETRMSATKALELELAASLKAAFQKITARAPRDRMQNMAPLVRRPVDIDPEGSYPELGVRSFGKGTFQKPELTGFEVGTKRLFRIEKGDLIFNIVFAWEGAVAVAGDEDDARVGSHRFLTCVPDPNRTTAEFLRYFFLTDEGLQRLGTASPGGAGRNRTLGLQALDKIEVPAPSLAAQQWFDALQTKAANARAKSGEAAAELGHLIPAMLDRVF